MVLEHDTLKCSTVQNKHEVYVSRTKYKSKLQLYALTCTSGSAVSRYACAVSSSASRYATGAAILTGGTRDAREKNKVRKLFKHLGESDRY